MAETDTKPRKRTTPAADDIQVGTSADAAPKSTTSKVKEQVKSLVGEATDTARSAANSGKDKAADTLDNVAKLAEDAARAVDDRLGGNYGDYARRASTTVSDFANSLKGKEIDDIIEDTKAFVRRSPVVAVGAAAAIGFVLTRLVKLGGTNDDRA